MSERRRKLGGSDIPKLLGISPYGGPFEVYQRVALGVEAPWNPKMERGAAVEPVLRSIGQDNFGFVIEDRVSDYHDHPTYDFARAQIDDVGLWKGRRAVVDYKSTSRWAKGWGPDGSDVVPEHIRAQLAWEMFCADIDVGVLLVGFGDDVPPPEIFNISHVVSYVVERDLLFESHCVAVAQDFWTRHILAGVPPEQTQTGKRKKKAS